ncbi:hypothetical protein Nmel_013875 [Mimus melanotis]
MMRQRVPGEALAAPSLEVSSASIAFVVVGPALC